MDAYLDNIDAYIERRTENGEVTPRWMVRGLYGGYCPVCEMNFELHYPSWVLSVQLAHIQGCRAQHAPQREREAARV